jgi:hypothetical protein
MRPKPTVTPAWALKFLIDYFRHRRAYVWDDAVRIIDAAYAGGRTARVLDWLMLNLSMSYAHGKLRHAMGVELVDGFIEGFLKGANRVACAGLTLEEAAENVYNYLLETGLGPDLSED